jgi:hypothetical protein
MQAANESPSYANVDAFDETDLLESPTNWLRNVLPDDIGDESVFSESLLSDVHISETEARKLTSDITFVDLQYPPENEVDTGLIRGRRKKSQIVAETQAYISQLTASFFEKPVIVHLPTDADQQIPPESDGVNPQLMWTDPVLPCDSRLDWTAIVVPSPLPQELDDLTEKLRKSREEDDNERYNTLGERRQKREAIKQYAKLVKEVNEVSDMPPGIRAEPVFAEGGAYFKLDWMEETKRTMKVEEDTLNAMAELIKTH